MKSFAPGLCLILFSSFVWGASSGSADFEKRVERFCQHFEKTGKMDCELNQSSPEEMGQDSFLIYCQAEMGQLGCDQLRSKVENLSFLKECTPEKICESELSDFDLAKCSNMTADMFEEQLLAFFKDHFSRNRCATDPKMKKDLIETYNKSEFVNGKFKITEKETEKFIAERNCDQIQAVILARGRAAIDDFNDRARSGHDDAARSAIRKYQNLNRIEAFAEKIGIKLGCYTSKAQAEIACAVSALVVTSFAMGDATKIGAAAIQKTLKKFGIVAKDRSVKPELKEPEVKTKETAVANASAAEREKLQQPNFKEAAERRPSGAEVEFGVSHHFETTGVNMSEYGPMYVVRDTAKEGGGSYHYELATKNSEDPRILKVNPKTKTIEVAAPETVNNVYGLNHEKAPIKFVAVNEGEIPNEQFAKLWAKNEYGLSVGDLLIHDLRDHVPGIVNLVKMPGSNWPRVVAAMKKLSPDYHKNKKMIDRIIEEIDAQSGLLTHSPGRARFANGRIGQVLAEYGF